MNKFTTFALIVALSFGLQTVFAQSLSENASGYDTSVRDYDFESNSYNISDEQLKEDVQTDILMTDKKASFWSKIINSSHFSSNTATKTWIPINKEE